ncbi:GntR family transcriptional regulator [Leptolyngbya sp. 15MV]|nr:GntR family transcriptional regulator [Leptolyngbya sp. 15MV]
MDPVRPERLYARIADRVVAMIQARGLGVGARLPPEGELARDLGVSRLAVREAMVALETPALYPGRALPDGRAGRRGHRRGPRARRLRRAERHQRHPDDRARRDHLFQRRLIPDGQSRQPHQRRGHRDPPDRVHQPRQRGRVQQRELFRPVGRRGPGRPRADHRLHRAQRHARFGPVRAPGRGRGPARVVRRRHRQRQFRHHALCPDPLFRLRAVG